MLSSPMSHYMRHVLLSYREISGLQNKLMINQKLKLMEMQLVKLQKEQPRNPKVQSMLDRIIRIKAAL